MVHDMMNTIDCRSWITTDQKIVAVQETDIAAVRMDVHAIGLAFGLAIGLVIGLAFGLAFGLAIDVAICLAFALDLVEGLSQ